MSRTRNIDHHLAIGNGREWHFVNSAWQDGADGRLAVPAESLCAEGTSLQGAHFAFNTAQTYLDCRVRFVFCLQSHSDTGIILRARDESHFYLLHFPNCGQASRAQHFWVALSKMDDSGYLRRIKFQMIPRVSSTRGTWLATEVSIERSRITVRIGDYGRFEAEDHTYSGPGCIGVYQFGKAEIKNILVEGDGVSPSPWRADAQQPLNWRHPLPATDSVWQQAVDIKRFDDGELLMLVNLQRNTATDETASATPHLTRSQDGGATWSDLEPVDFGEIHSSWSPARMHITPNGRLIAMNAGTDHKLVSESVDRGRTWRRIGSCNLHVGPPRDPPVHNLAPQGFLNLEDGAILAFQLLGVDLDSQARSLFTWGSWHCQAFCSRSDDDGATWSESVNIDTPGFDEGGNKLDGSLDFTEASAVQLSSGRIMAFIRPIYSPTMWETWSDDGGRTWGAAVRGPFPGYAAPNMVRTTSGALLIAHRLPGLTLHCSLDEGLTWDQGTMIDTGLWAMGSMVEIEPDVVLYVYWDSFESHVRAQRFRITPSGIEPVR